MADVLLRDVVKRYGPVEVVKQLSLSIADGEFLVLVGSSGCGKSTTLRMVAGLEHPDAGDVVIGDRRVNDVAPKDRDIAMVFQNYALYPHLSVYDNIGFSLSLRKAPRAEIQQRVTLAADMLGLGALLQRKPKELSGGQRQRVALARALVREPQVFLMDEPLSNLDAQLRGQTRTEIKRLHQQIRTTVIYVTHDQVEAMTMGDRIAVMRGGVIVQLDTPKQIYRKPNCVFVAGFIGSPSMNFLSAGVSKRDEANWTLTVEGQSIALGVHPAGVLADWAGDRVLLGIRPESLILPDRRRHDRVAELRTCVEVVEPAGSRTYLHLKVGTQPVIAEVETLAVSSLVSGDQLTLLIDLDELHLFDPASEGAIYHADPTTACLGV